MEQAGPVGLTVPFTGFTRRSSAEWSGTHDAHVRRPTTLWFVARKHRRCDLRQPLNARVRWLRPRAGVDAGRDEVAQVQPPARSKRTNASDFHAID